MKGRPATIAELQFARHAAELEQLDLAARFERIFSTNLWSDPSSRSGVGSNLEATNTLRLELPRILRTLGARTLLDAPCGDFAWMQHVDLGGIEYIGADIVPAIIERNRRQYEDSARRFTVLDLTHDELPRADVLLCRDCLVHLSYENILKALNNIAKSPIEYVLLTSFPGRARNVDVADGDWRPLDFQAPPFDFPAPRRTILEGCAEHDGAYSDKALLLWSTRELRPIIAAATVQFVRPE